MLYLFLSRRSNPELGIRRRYEALVTFAFVILGTLVAPTHLAAQWLKYPTAGVPRKADGKVDMSAPSPRMPDGKPDFSGIWTTGEPNVRRTGGLSSPKEATGPREPQSPNDGQSPGDASASRQMANIGVDLPGGLPYQPWLVPIVKELPFQIIQGTNKIIIAYEFAGASRIINMDDIGPAPTDSYMGWSLGKWDGDTLVIDTTGVRDDTWIDWIGSVLTTAAKVREQIRRPDFGHLEIQVTVDDPKAYTKPWTVTLKQRIVVDAELIDEICLENEQSLKHMK